jgi:hypothetical protein
MRGVSLITDYKSPAYQLPITGYELPITGLLVIDHLHQAVRNSTQLHPSTTHPR